jgi:uncharacterized membrane protein YhaH (DUF805 family)
MNFTQAIVSGFRNYVNGGGRASRSEYWYWTLFEVIVTVVATGADMLIFPGNETGPIGLVTGLGLFLPSLAVSIRRLHDINRTGYWVLISLTIVGILLLIYWACVRGTEGENDFGPDPLGHPGTPAVA